MNNWKRYLPVLPALALCGPIAYIAVAAQCGGGG